MRSESTARFMVPPTVRLKADTTSTRAEHIGSVRVLPDPTNTSVVSGFSRTRRTHRRCPASAGPDEHIGGVRLQPDPTNTSVVSGFSRTRRSGQPVRDQLSAVISTADGDDDVLLPVEHVGH